MTTPAPLFLSEYEPLAHRLNAAWEKFIYTNKTADFVLTMHEASMLWEEIRAAQCDEGFVKLLRFVKWNENARRPQDKWTRLRTWAAEPIVVKYADRQAKRGWSVWREIPKVIKIAGADYVEQKFASGTWGADLTREELDMLVGNADRHPRHE